MKINVYCYDDINNPNCGGGGAYRDYTIHELLSDRHEINFYTGKFKGAKASDKGTFHCRHLGCGATYLLSRITFSFVATVHSLFSKADVIVLCYSIYSPVLTFLFKSHKSVVMFFHITGKEVFKKYSILGIFPWIAEKLVLNSAKNYITLTDSMSEDIKDKRPEVNTIAGYVSFDTSLLSGTITDDSFILCFGRIDIHMKGLDILIPAFEIIAKEFSDYKLIIAGRGKESDLKKLRQMISESEFKERIEIIVNIPNDRKKILFQSATFVCMPSRFEGWNIAAMEAAASYKATLGTNIHGLKDAIKENETGFLVAPENVDELAEKMKELIINPELRNKLGKNGHERAKQFTLEKIALIQENFYLNILNKKIIKIKQH
jgi:glycosyltransferase involved in cell wall biosynthesis